MSEVGGVRAQLRPPASLSKLFLLTNYCSHSMARQATMWAARDADGRPFMLAGWTRAVSRLDGRVGTLSAVLQNNTCIGWAIEEPGQGCVRVDILLIYYSPVFQLSK